MTSPFLMCKFWQRLHKNVIIKTAIPYFLKKGGHYQHVVRGDNSHHTGTPVWILSRCQFHCDSSDRRIGVWIHWMYAQSNQRVDWTPRCCCWLAVHWSSNLWMDSEHHVLLNHSKGRSFLTERPSFFLLIWTVLLGNCLRECKNFYRKINLWIKYIINKLE